MERAEKSFWQDARWVGLYCLILYGFAGFSGRPLTMHEARLPETSREMLAGHQWLLPTSGGRPWLERPPLPHWLVISSMKLFGHDDRVWIVRLPSAIMGTVTVLLTLYIARKWFDPITGLVAAFLLATSFKFYQYACLAEDDVYLAALVALAAALYTYAETASNHKQLNGFSFITNRPWPIWGFFIVLGLSNLTKGPLLGMLVLGTPVAVFAFSRAYIEKSLQPVFRFTWLWGWIVLIGLTVAWPLWAHHVYPDVIENWKYDYLGRMSGTYSAINEPWWYYPPKLFVGLLPSAPFCVVGIWIAARSVSTGSNPIGHLWILTWAMLPLVVLSIPKGKHDHYLLPFLAPWAMLGALVVVKELRRMRFGKVPLVVTMLVVLAGYCVGEALFAARTDHTVDDTAFLLRCRDEIPKDVPLYINGKLGPPGNLDFFRMQFYSRSDAVLLHNLSFLRGTSITSPVVYVIARQIDERLLTQLGHVERIDQSPKSHDNETEKGRFTLFRLTFSPQLLRYPAPATITSLQAMERAPGPWCGPPLH